MARFNAAVMDGAMDAKFQNRYNYLLDLLDMGYIVEKRIDGVPIKLEMSPNVGFAFYQGGGASGWVYRGGLVLRDGELALLTDILGTVDDAYHFIKFDEHKLYDADTEIYSLLKFYASDNSASPSPIETFRIASKYWEATDTAQTFLGIGTNGTTVDAAEVYFSAGMSLETPVGSSYLRLNTSPLSDAAVIDLLAINPSENSSGFQIYANGSTPKIDVMVNYTSIGQWLSDGLKIDGNYVWHDGNCTYGSGANGSWIKFANGTMMCKHSWDLACTAATLKTDTWTYPSAFYATPTEVTISLMSVSTTNAFTTDFIYLTPANTTKATSNVKFSATQTYRLSMTAWGRWKA